MLLSEIWYDESMAVIEQKPIDLYIGCGDRRLNELFDSYEGKIIFIRNASGNLKTLRKTIENKITENLKSDGTTNIRKIRIFGHTDCGALGIVQNVLRGEEQVSIQMRTNLVNQYKDFVINPALSRQENARELERFHVAKQKENAQLLLDQIHVNTGIDTRNIIIESTLINTHKHDKTDTQKTDGKKEYVGIVSDPMTIPNYIKIAQQANVDPFYAYFFNVDSQECAGGVEIFAKLRVKKFLVTYENEEDFSKALNRIVQVKETVNAVVRDAHVAPFKIELRKEETQKSKAVAKMKARVN